MLRIVDPVVFKVFPVALQITEVFVVTPFTSIKVIAPEPKEPPPEMACLIVMLGLFVTFIDETGAPAHVIPVTALVVEPPELL